MPSVTHERIPSAKKRRRDDDIENSYTSGNIQIPLYADYTSNYPSPLQLANPTSLYTSSHPVLDTTHGILADKSSYANPTALHPYPPTLRKIKPIAINKKQRISISDDVHHREDSHHGMRAKSNSPTSASHPHPHHQKQHALLSKVKCLDRCHICFRKPSKKADLDSYADCQGCGQRTCYVCMRQCPGWTSSFHQQKRHPDTGEQEAQTHDIPLASSSPGNSFTMVDADAEAEADHDALAEKESQRPRSTPGWHANGHRETICGQCCEERGDNGDVVCFGCLPSFGG